MTEKSHVNLNTINSQEMNVLLRNFLVLSNLFNLKLNAFSFYNS
jgi:hypothetical protein